MTANLTTAHHPEPTSSSTLPHLWVPQPGYPDSGSLYQLRISVLKDKEEQGNCKSQSHFSNAPTKFNHAAENICTRFAAKPYNCVVRVVKSAPTNVGTAAKTHMCEIGDVNIMFDSSTAEVGWAAFLLDFARTMKTV